MYGTIFYELLITINDFISIIISYHIHSSAVTTYY